MYQKLRKISGYFRSFGLIEFKISGDYSHVNELQAMSLDEFEQYYREAMSNVLNRLQRLTLLSSNLQGAIEEISTSLQQLNRTTEKFINDQRQNSDESGSES